MYATFGTVAIIYGVTALLFPTVLLWEAAQSSPLAHILREQGAATIALGLMSFWCIFNYDRRRTVHYCLTIFTLLIAGIHWFDYFGGRSPWMSPAYNTIPFVVFLAMALGRRNEKAYRNLARGYSSHL